MPPRRGRSASGPSVAIAAEGRAELGEADALAGPGAGGSPHAAAVIAPTANPFSAAAIASWRSASSPERPKRSARAAQPATAPGTVTERGPSLLDRGHRLGVSRRRPRRVQAVEAAVLPEEREGIAADPGRHRLGHAEDGGGGEPGIDRVATLFEGAQSRPRRERLARGHHRLGGDGWRACGGQAKAHRGPIASHGSCRSRPSFSCTPFHSTRACGRRRGRRSRRTGTRSRRPSCHPSRSPSALPPGRAPCSAPWTGRSCPWAARWAAISPSSSGDRPGSASGARPRRHARAGRTRPSSARRGTTPSACSARPARRPSGTPQARGSSLPTPTPSSSQRARGMALERPITELVATLETLRDRPDSRPTLPTIDVPVLVLVGERGPRDASSRGRGDGRRLAECAFFAHCGSGPPEPARATRRGDRGAARTFFARRPRDGRRARPAARARRGRHCSTCARGPSTTARPGIRATRARATSSGQCI